MSTDNIIVRITDEQDQHFTIQIIEQINQAAANPDTGLCRRSEDLIRKKIRDAEAVIAVTTGGCWVGFCYIAPWEQGRFVSSCALTVSPAYRVTGVARLIKERALLLAQTKYPDAKIFGLTTSLAVMKINSLLGYKPVTYTEITQDEAFWESCKTCQHESILLSKQKKNCLCTAMIFQK